MRSWRLAAGFINGQYATPLVEGLRFIGASNNPILNNQYVIQADIPAYKAGDLLLACVMHRYGINIPAGWTSVAMATTTYGGSSNQFTQLLKKVATADSAGESLVITATGNATGRMSFQVLVFRSPEALDVVDVSTSFAADTGTQQYIAPLAAAGDKQMTVSLASSYLAPTMAPYQMTVASPFTQTSTKDTVDAGNQIRLGVGYSSSGSPAATFSIPQTIDNNSWAAITARIGKPTTASYVYFNDFETDTHGFTGAWARTTDWKKSGSYSLRSTNQGQASTDNTATLALTVQKASIMTFDGYVNGEVNNDGMLVTLDGLPWTNADITITGANPGSITSNMLSQTAAGPVEFSYKKRISPGSRTFTFVNHKDSSVDLGLDGSFIDNVKVEETVVVSPANPYFFWDFEVDDAGIAGNWALTTEWAMTGTKSLGRTNKGAPGTTSSCNMSTNVPADAIVEFYFYTQGEVSYDGLLLILNGVGWRASDITPIDGTYTITSANNLTSLNGFLGKFSRAVPAGSVTFSMSFTKDGSGDVGLDGGFIDLLSVAPMPANYARKIGLHFDPVGDSSAIVDVSGRAWTPDPGVAISNDQSVFGGYSLRTRTGVKANCIATPPSSDLQITGDFTVRAKLYPVALDNTGSALVFFAQDAILKRSYSFRLTTNFGAITGIQAILFTSPSTYEASTANLTMDFGKWYDVEFTRKGSTMYIFLDGQLVYSGNSTTVPFTDGTVGATIGGDRYTDGQERFPGYIDDFEFYQRALHTAAFTPSPNPFVD